MDSTNNLFTILSTALTFQHVFYCFAGSLLGNIIGLIPGIGPIATISMLLPFVYSLHGVDAIILLSGIFYGAQYSDAISAIIMKMTHAGSVVLCEDGHMMHQKKQTGLALFTAGISCFIGGTFAIIAITFLSGYLAELAFHIGPAEYVLLILLGMLTISSTTNDTLSGLGMVCIGVLLGSVGTDLATGHPRFTLGQLSLADGVPIICITMGCFGIAETIRHLNKNTKYVLDASSIKLMPSWDEMKTILKSALRGSFVGGVLGLLPGGGPTTAQFFAYSVEKKINPKVGTGVIEGVAGPAAADESSARTSFLPLLSLGLPENPVMSLIFSALVVIGFQPGPNMVNQNPNLFWELILSMWIGNIILLIFNVPLVKIWLNIFKIPYKFLYPSLLIFSMIGTYYLNRNFDDLYLNAFFGLFGYLIISLGMSAGPLILGFVLGPMLEENFRRQMIISSGNFLSFLHNEISVTLFCIIVTISLYKMIKFAQVYVK